MIGGLKRIARVTEFVVPFMAVTYIVFCLLLLACIVGGILIARKR